MSNEKGFAYPMSLCMLVFFSSFLLLFVEQNWTEKRFYKETETILVAEYYLLSALKESEERLQNEALQVSGKFVYTKGEVTYQRRVLSPNSEEIRFTLRMATKEQWQATAYYDYEQQKMIKWIEWN